MHHIKSLSVLFILLITTLSCSVFQKNIQPDIEKVTYRTLLENHARWLDAVSSMNGNMRLTLDTPDYSGNFNASIIMNAPDSLLLTVSGPFGMHLGKVHVSKNRFIFYNQVMNQFYKGSKKDFEGRNFLQFPLEIGKLKDVFAARDPFDVLQKKTFEVRDGNYYLEARNGDYNYNIWFEPQHLLIKKIEYLRNGRVEFLKEYDNFREVNGIYFPHLVNFVRPEEKQGLSIIITQLELNQPIDPAAYKIKVADSATQIDLSL